MCALRQIDAPLFEDVSVASVSIVLEAEACPRYEQATWTVPTETSSLGILTVSRVEAETQCEVDSLINENEKKDEVDSAVLRRLAALVEYELLRDDRHCFDGYEPWNSAGREEAVYKYTLTTPKVDALKSDLQCVAASWNAVGSVLVAAYGRNDDVGEECDGIGVICSWSLFASDFEWNKPRWSLEYPSYFSAVCCHPSMPSVVAAGTRAGEVVAFSIEAEEEVVGASELAKHSHYDRVMAIQWLKRPSSSSRQEHMDLVSLGLDGKILWWRIDCGVESTEELKPHRGVLVAKTAAEASRHNFLPPAATAMARLVGLGNLFVVGCAEGEVLGIRVDTNGYAKEDKIVAPKKVGKLEWDPDAQAMLLHLPRAAQQKLVKHVEQYCAGKTRVARRDIFDSNPKQHYLNAPPFGAVTEFRSHDGAVFALKASPFHRHLFLTVSDDGLARLYSAVQTSPLLELDKPNQQDDDQYTVVGHDNDSCEDPYLDDKRKSPDLALVSADWSKVRPLVFATAGSDATVRVYDLATDLTIPVLQLKLPVPKGLDEDLLDRHARIFAVAFNHKQRDFLAAADAAGRVHVWQLPWHLANSRNNEVDQLEQIVNTRFFFDDNDEGD